MTRAGVPRRGATLRAASLPMLCALAVVAACGPQEPRAERVWTNTFEYRITTDPRPPRARESTLYRIVVLDRETRELVQGGEGRIFATSADNANTWDVFEPAAEPGVYTARLNFVHAGQWRVSLQFRRDSTARLEKPADDMVQTVGSERPISERAFPTAKQPQP